MKIWKLKFELDDYDNLVPVKEFSAEEIWAFDGHELKKNWKPLAVKRMEPEKGLELTDAPGFTIPVFSRRALNILEPLIHDSVEVLELLFMEKEYFGINVISVLDVIDYEEAQYIKFKSSDRIMVFTKYSFKMCDELKKHSIFKIVDEPRRGAFVSDKFKEAVEENELTGFKFELVWDSEQ